MSLNPIERSLLKNEVIECLREVYDPELPINIYDLGLIYELEVDEEARVRIVMTLTSPMCPVAESLPGEVEEAARQVPGVARVDLELTWDPPFSIEMMSEEARLTLGLI
ncbi:MAG: SUF system Fe-S cluster assembly protein [Fimbriimonadaceae bacterium]|nr:SUF system Fe-S cluster assembly protein [Chthonomonadaceae bacterium]MCO5298079.1 SUF system Fe-S cluster assembly protein [Fimbriimonadaceae bacterium]